MEEDHGRSGAARAPAGAPGASAAGEAIGAARPTAMLLAALGATLALLLAHAWLYRFLTDDAFISFRYSVNLAHGHGLVFNPGWEPVEGYSNFLWVLLLAGLDVLGMRPETISVPLSFLCTLALGAIVAHFAWRQSSSREPLWIMVVPGLLLAVTRSVAVWSSSGLETRFFELLIVAGALRMVAEVESHERAAPRMPLAPSAFALATLTRPDGLLLSLSAFGAAGLYLASRSPRALPRFVAGLAPFALLVGAHYAFRHAYYGDWLPNTYYAKVDGQTWWSSGFAYLSAFAIEYAVPLWLPFLAAGVVACARRGRAFVPLLFAALVVPHALYVASIGGDHFEYRPVDLYFPFAFLLMGSGAGWLAMGGASAPAPHHVESPATNRARSLAVAAGLLIVVVGLWDLPWQSHRQFPDHYITGFPGVPIQHDAEAQAFLDPARDPIYCTPPLRPLAESFRARLRDLTANFVGVRQEEHRLFLETVSPEGRRIHELIDQGVLPRDVYIAMGSVGAIPYYSGARVLDRVGLTDAHVAHSPVALQNGRRLMAHDKAATIEYARERGVDLWTYDPVHLIVSIHSRRLLVAIRDAMFEDRDAWVAPLSDTEYVLCRLPLGIERASQRMPRLHLVAATDSSFIARWAPLAEAEFSAALTRDSSDFQSLGQLAFVQAANREYGAAAASFERLLSSWPESSEAWEYLGVCRMRLGDLAGASDALARALSQYQKSGSAEAIARVSAERAALASALAGRARGNGAPRR